MYYAVKWSIVCFLFVCLSSVVIKNGENQVCNLIHLCYFPVYFGGCCSIPMLCWGLLPLCGFHEHLTPYLYSNLQLLYRNFFPVYCSDVCSEGLLRGRCEENGYNVRQENRYVVRHRYPTNFMSRSCLYSEWSFSKCMHLWKYERI